MDKTSKIFVAGHNGLVGSAIVDALSRNGFSNILTINSAALDLRNQEETLAFFKYNKPEYVFLCAAKVGGIKANNQYRGAFIYDNLMIQSNVIHSSYSCNVKKLLFLGSSCIYPKKAEQPIKEDYLLTGPLEPTNRPYAVAKIAGIELCQSYNQQYGTNYISLMPTNLYGEGDNFDLNNSHVIPALVKKALIAKESNAKHIEIWGTGKPLREFLHAKDLADASLIVMQQKQNDEHLLNVGSGEECSIKSLAELILELVDYPCDIKLNPQMPDGTYRKILDSSKINQLGWYPKISLKDGLRSLINHLQIKS